MSKDFKQYDSKWARHSYCKTTMKAAGCGPTAVADIFYNFDTSITPVKVSDWFTAHGYDSYKQGTVWTGIPAYFNRHGAKGVQLNANSLYGNRNSQAESNWKGKMQSGKYWGILLMGKGYWTGGGHYIAVTAYKDGKYYVMDPASARRTGWHKWSDFDGVVKIFYLIDVPVKKKESSKKKQSQSKKEKSDSILVDGLWGIKTTKALQKIFKTEQDGVISNQPMKNRKYLSACSLESWRFWETPKFYKDGSDLIKAIQKKFGIEQDGFCGESTVKALQKFLNVAVDGDCDEKTVKALQKWINKQ